MEIKRQITQLTAIIEAMETLTLTGSKNCGTYYNCMQMLLRTIQELQAINEQQKQNETVQEDLIEEVTE